MRGRECCVLCFDLVDDNAFVVLCLVEGDRTGCDTVVCLDAYHCCLLVDVKTTVAPMYPVA